MPSSKFNLVLNRLLTIIDEFNDAEIQKFSREITLFIQDRKKKRIEKISITDIARFREAYTKIYVNIQGDKSEGKFEFAAGLGGKLYYMPGFKNFSITNPKDGLISKFPDVIHLLEWFLAAKNNYMILMKELEVKYRMTEDDLADIYISDENYIHIYIPEGTKDWMEYCNNEFPSIFNEGKK